MTVFAVGAGFVYMFVDYVCFRSVLVVLSYFVCGLWYLVCE